MKQKEENVWKNIDKDKNEIGNLELEWSKNLENNILSCSFKNL
jgi:hypothetical protein